MCCVDLTPALSDHRLIFDIHPLESMKAKTNTRLIFYVAIYLQAELSLTVFLTKTLKPLLLT